MTPIVGMIFILERRFSRDKEEEEVGQAALNENDGTAQATRKRSALYITF